MHFIRQNMILSLSDDRAAGETYRLAHHVSVHNGKRGLMVAALRYNDIAVKIDGAWLFSRAPAVR